MQPNLKRLTSAGISFLVALSLVGCLAGPAPKPSEAVYDEDFSRAEHVERLVREERFSEAFVVYMEMEAAHDPRWAVIRDLALGLTESATTEEHLTRLSDRVREQSVESGRESWPEQRQLLDRASGLSAIYEGQQDEDHSSVVSRFVRTVEQTRAEWLLAKPRLVAECGVSEYRECIDQYPVPSEYDDWENETRSELAVALISRLDLAGSSSHALRALFDRVDEVYESLEIEKPQGVIPETFVIDRASWSSGGDAAGAAASNVKIGPVFPSPLHPSGGLIEEIGANPGHRFQVFLVRSSESVTPGELAVYSQPSEFRVSERYVSNPEYQRAQARVNRLRAQMQQAQASAASAQDPISQGFAQGQVMGLQSRLTNAINALSSIPMQIAEPVYQTYEYTVRKISLEKETRFDIVVIDHEQGNVGRGSLSVRGSEEVEVASGVRAHDRFNRHSGEGLREISEAFRDADVVLEPSDVLGGIEFASESDGIAHVADSLEQRRGVSRGEESGQSVSSRSADAQAGAAAFFPGVVVVSSGGSLGSGFYVRENLVVTNAHVVQGMINPEIRNRDGRVHEGRVIATDSAGDLALVEVREVGVPLPLFSGAVPVGEDVVAIGHPRGLEFTITRGVISATRNLPSFGESIPVVQTDTAINPGNSGGPLLLDGKVLGVNTVLLADSQGIGFAVHADRVRQILRATGR